MHEKLEFWVTLFPVIAINVYIISACIIFAFIYKKRPKTDEIEMRHSSVILNKWIREFWFWITQPILNFLIWSKLSPNILSVMGTFIAGLSMVAFAGGFLGLGGWLMIGGACLDLFDGRVARLTGRVTPSGAFFDSSMDRISETVAFAGIIYMYRDSAVFWLALLALNGSQMTSYTRCKGESMGVNYTGGMMQRPERIAYLGASAVLLPMIVWILSQVWPQTFADRHFWELKFYIVPLAFVAFFSNLASVNRIRNTMKILDSSVRKSS